MQRDRREGNEMDGREVCGGLEAHRGHRSGEMPDDPGSAPSPRNLHTPSISYGYVRSLRVLDTLLYVRVCVCVCARA